MTDRTYPAGVTSWVDVDTPDVDASTAFYSALLGWTFEPATPPDLPFRYLIAQLDGRDVGGLGGPAEPHGVPARWNTYVAVDDAEAAAAAVTAAGGRVLAPPTAAGEGGVNAVCADPSGSQFRLWQAHARLGSQVTNEPGSWNFSDLHTSDRTAAERFYGEVFGWDFVDAGFGTMLRVPGYGDHLAGTVDPGIHERQAAVDAPPGFADAIGWVLPEDDLGPGWHVTFAVADRDNTAALAESLGGRVLRREETGWTRVAVVEDPQGAVFTASQFTPPSG